MIAKSFFYAAACAAALVSANAASAAVLIDTLPGAGASYKGDSPGIASDQNVVVQINLSQNVKLTGYTVVASDGFVFGGESVEFKIREDVAGAPAATNLHSIFGTIGSATPLDLPGVGKFVLATLTFDPIELTAGTYWVGMSGVSDYLWLSGFNLGSPVAPQYYLNQDAVTGPFTGSFKAASMSYQLHGEVVEATAPVPEPATWAMMIGGLGLVGASMRRRKVAVRFA